MLMADSSLREFPIAGDESDSWEGFWRTNRKTSKEPFLHILVKGVSTSYDSTGGKLIGVDMSVAGDPKGVSELLFLQSVSPDEWLRNIQGYAVK